MGDFMKDKILEILSGVDALTVEELSDRLSISGVNEIKELMASLNELEADFTLYKSNKNKYMLFDKSHLYKGVLHVTKKGYGFLEASMLDEDIYIDSSNMNGAIDGDTVIVEPVLYKGKTEGRIVRIVKRELKEFVGEYISTKKGRGKIKLDDSKVKINIEIDNSDSMGAVDGHKVVAKTIRQIDKNKYKGKVIKIIGHKDDPGVDILSVAYKYSINNIFPDEVIEQLKDIPSVVVESELNDRKDLRNEMIFTIDGADTKDIDDAVSIKKLDNGNYELGVHIADVSYYVKENTPLDIEAYERGTSVYLVDSVIPMLPHELSNGICSLNEGVDRLAISCVMEIDGSGKTVNYEIFQSVINSKKKMTYTAVNSIIEDNIIPEGYEEYADTLLLMNELARILRKYKNSRGYIEFNSSEPKIIVDEEKKPIEIQRRVQRSGEKLIEDFMIQANETVASHIFYMELPFVYRIHEKPKEEKIQDFLHFISGLGYSVKGKLKLDHPETVRELLLSLKDKPEYPVLSDLLLRCMRKAIYSKDNLGHFGLGSKCYTHFTSPIRRYPDTTVHRLLRKYLFENNINSEVVKFWDEKLVVLCEHTSLKEQNAVDCEREVDDMKMAEYMTYHIGEEFEGYISGVTNFGMFVELDNLVEGLVRIQDLKGDFFVYNEKDMSLTGEHKKLKYKLGDRVRVKVVNASKEERQVDFILV